MQGANELLGAGGQADLGEHLGEDALAHAFERGHALTQGGGEVQLTAHGPPRDLGDLRPGAGALGNELNDLLLNEGGVHVHDQQAGPLLHQGAAAQRATKSLHGPRLARPATAPQPVRL